jgi:hypothetical protein
MRLRAMLLPRMERMERVYGLNKMLRAALGHRLVAAGGLQLIDHVLRSSY